MLVRTALPKRFLWALYREKTKNSKTCFSAQTVYDKKTFEDIVVLYILSYFTHRSVQFFKSISRTTRLKKIRTVSVLGSWCWYS